MRAGYSPSAATVLAPGLWLRRHRLSVARAAWIGAGGGVTAFGMADNTTNSLNQFLWSSRHTGIMQFALTDGSVRSVKRNVALTTVPTTMPNGPAGGNFPNEWWVFQELSGKTDGGTRDQSAVLN